MRLFENASYRFLENRRRAYVLSAAVIGLGLAFALLWQATRGSWLNYGVDFTGGTLVQVRFQQPTSVAELRSTLEPVVPGSEITRFGGENEFLVRAPQFAEEGTNISDVMDAALRQTFGDDAVEIVRTEAVGPRIGEELQRKAVIAILLSFVLTLIYLAFRFEWRFGVAAVVATAHDILITMGLLSAFQLEVSLPTIAAVLTIIGYSLNDTIIVFDRVRENLKKHARRMPFADLLNLSINETLPRTVLTGGTTLAALIALATLGGATIRDFALILIAGIIIGTFSSIFVASPVLYEIQQRWGEKEPPKKASAARRTGAASGV